MNPNNSLAEVTFEDWVKALRNALDALVPGMFELKASNSKPSEAPARVWFRQSLRTAATETVTVGADPIDWTTIGKTILATLGIDDPAPEDIDSTVTDLIAQCHSAFAELLTVRCGSEVAFDALDKAAERPSDLAYSVSIAADGIEPMLVEVLFAEALLTRLSPPASDEPAEAPPDVPELFKSLSIDVHGVLGKTSLSLGSIVKLNVGSVIDLDRAVNDPTMVVIQGRVIAMGKVVLCKGNYAIRIEGGPISSLSETAKEGPIR